MNPKSRVVSTQFFESSESRVKLSTCGGFFRNLIFLFLTACLHPSNQSMSLHATNVFNERISDELGNTKKATALMPHHLTKFLDHKTVMSLSSSKRITQTAPLSASLANYDNGKFIVLPANARNITRKGRIVRTEEMLPCHVSGGPHAFVQKIMTPSSLDKLAEEAIVHGKQHVQEGVFYAFEDSHFENNKVTEPAVRPIQSNISAALLEKVQNNEIFVLTPYERKQIFEYEKQQLALRNELLKNTREREKIRSTIHLRYPNGVPNFDSPALANSLIYSSDVHEVEALRASQARSRLNRLAVLQEKNRSEAFAPDILIHNYTQPREQTFEKIFVRTQQEKLIDSDRTQRLRNIQTQGRDYNIVTGTKLNFAPNCSEGKQRHPSLMLHSIYK